MMHKIASALLLTTLALTAYAEDIATVHVDSTLVNLKSNTSATYSHLVEMTLMNDKAENMVAWSLTCGKGEKLSEFRMTLTNADGKVVRELKRSDLAQTDLSQALADDAHTYYCNPSLPGYPMHVKIQYSVQLSGGVTWLPRFMPQTEGLVTVEHASYTLITNGIPVKYHRCNTEVPVTEDANQVRVVMDNLSPIINEPWQPPLRERIPYVLFSPNQINYFGHSGDMQSWETFAQWERSLMMGRDEMPEELRTKVHALTDNCQNDRERVKALYNYLEQTTRYVSIQLGVAGYQPMTVAEVYKNGFGDCKALTHYMMVMLAEVGIASNYVNINMDRKHLALDFTMPGHFNHVILQVPLKNETLWLECTSPSLPLGYVHESIAGNDAVALTADGAKVVKLPEYGPDESVQETLIDIKLQEDGSAHLSLSQQSTNLEWEFLRSVEKAEAKKQREFLQEVLQVNNPSVEALTFLNHKQTEQALMEMKAEVSIPKYARKMGNNLGFYINPIHRGFSAAPKNDNRQNPITLQYAYTDREIIHITLPEGYTVETLPDDVALETPYGTFKAHAEMDGQQAVVRHEFRRNRVTQPAEDYPNFVEFMRNIRRAYTQQLVVKKG